MAASIKPVATLATLYTEAVQLGHVAVRLYEDIPVRDVSASCSH